MTTINVTITRQYKGTEYGKVAPPIYVGGNGAAQVIPPVNSPPENVVVIPYPEPAEFAFVNTSLPTIPNFNLTYSPTYGRNPRFTLIVIEGSIEGAEDSESENELVQYIPPKLTIVDDEITTVSFELSGLGNVSGKIIINK